MAPLLINLSSDSSDSSIGGNNSNKEKRVRFAETVQIGNAAEFRHSSWYNQQDYRQFSDHHDAVAQQVYSQGKSKRETDNEYKIYHHGIRTPKMMAISMLNVQASIQVVLAEQLVQNEIDGMIDPEMIRKAHKDQIQEKVRVQTNAINHISCLCGDMDIFSQVSQHCHN